MTNPLLRGLNISLKTPLLRSGLHSHSSKASQIYHNVLTQPGFHKTSLSDFNMTIYEAKPAPSPHTAKIAVYKEEDCVSRGGPCPSPAGPDGDGCVGGGVS